MQQYHIRLSSRANIELTEAVVWYEEKEEGLGEFFRVVTDSRLKLIQQYPKRYPKVKGDLRQVSIKKFPYAIIYFIESDSEIVVYSIFHHSRNPTDRFR